MADIFISYSKRDADTVRLLAAALEAQGWTVWWDTSLEAGDAFRKVIMTELAKARAVIVVWTETSVSSDWVMSEAGRGHADGKLIPVRARDLDYKKIPPPFDNLHTEVVDAHERIAASVTSQLAKPVVTPNLTWLATKELRYQMLTWVSIVGGALTLFSGFSALVQLSDVARLVVEHWQSWMQAFWRTLFGWIGLRLPKPYAPILSGCTFLLGIAIGQRVQAHITTGESGGSYLAGRWWWPFAGGVAAIGTVFMTSWAVRTFGADIGASWLFSWFALLTPFVAAIAATKDKFAASVSVALATCCLWLLIVSPLSQLPTNSFFGGPRIPAEEDPMVALFFVIGILSWLLPSIVLTLSPTKPLLRRLVFLAIGVLILLALNAFALHGGGWLARLKQV